jgi:hypothetical protein
MVGRLPEALADADEALAEARLIGEVGRVQGCLAERAWVHFLLGDREGAIADTQESRASQGQAEPQAVIYEALHDALVEWPSQPASAARRIQVAAESPDAAPASLLDAAPVGIRMAFRADEPTALQALVDSFLRVAERATGPVSELRRRWFRALLEGPAVALPEVIEVATGFEAIEYPLQAADAFADAALIAERLGRIDEVRALAAQAQALYAACSGAPLLGDMPRGVAPSAPATTAATA